MTRYKIKYQKIISSSLVFVIFLAHVVKCSEFPERECCDLTTTTTVGPLPIPAAIPTVKTIATSSSQAIPTGRSGSNIKTAIAILNCILARQLCFEDPSCSAILEIIPRVCGPVPVACSTVTVTKCQAALRTLQAFPFFRPTCLCKEPGVDPDCNNFRDFLFDHPCGFVLKKEKDPYPIDALPTCNHALSVCQQERKCLKLFDDFKAHCKVRDNKCRMEDRDLCHESWTNLRLSPMFGCICPNNHMKRRCDRIFSVVNHNPCVDIILLPHSYSGLSETSSNSVYSESSEQPHVSSFPYFLFPSRKIPLALASHRPATDDYYTSSSSSNNKKIYIYNITKANEMVGTGTDLDEHDHNLYNNNHKSSSRNEFMLHQHKTIISARNITSSDNSHHRRVSHQQEEFDIMEIVRVLGMDENYQQIMFDENMALIETPLIAPSSTHYIHHHKVLSYPYNVTAFQGEISAMDNALIDSTDKLSVQDIPSDTSSEIIKLHFQSTCHTALETCREDPFCSASLQPMLMHCELHRCNRNACMIALQSFYKGPHEDLSLDVAFCLCKKTSNRHDICMIAQEKLHPVCAQRPPDSINPQNSNGIFYHPPPACHSVADLCKEDPECRSKLEWYEQACAVDSVTKKCAGRPSSCRSSMLGILGTQLRMTCACHGTDFQHLYECLGWQRLLWLNPCVVESQKDFHMKRLTELGLFLTSTTTTATSTISLSPDNAVITTDRISVIVSPTSPNPFQPTYPHSTTVKAELPETNYVESPNSISKTLLNNIDKQSNVDDASKGSVSSEEQLVTINPTTEFDTAIASTSTTSTTSMAYTTAAPRNCVAQRPHQSDQLILEGSSRRIYSLDDTECSELCSCGESLTLTCHALCVPFAPCRTALAFYNHASPAYQAFRGRCLCYSGRFICMRPPPGEYLLPGGIFLLLGYSSTDEALLRPHTNLGVQDAVRALQQYVVTRIDNQTSCTLTLFNMTEENIIISARLPHDPKVTSIELLRREKDQCTSILETISHHINAEHTELQAHRLLSIFKMSEVQVIMPENSSSTSMMLSSKILTQYLLIATALISTVRWIKRNIISLET